MLLIKSSNDFFKLTYITHRTHATHVIWHISRSILKKFLKLIFFSKILPPIRRHWDYPNRVWNLANRVFSALQGSS